MIMMQLYVTLSLIVIGAVSTPIVGMIRTMAVVFCQKQFVNMDPLHTPKEPMHVIGTKTQVKVSVSMLVMKRLRGVS